MNMPLGFEPLSPSSLPRVSAAAGDPGGLMASPTPNAASHGLTLAAPASSAFVPITPHAHATPTISVQKDGDRITHIIVRCTCGQVINLECGY